MFSSYILCDFRVYNDSSKINNSVEQCLLGKQIVTQLVKKLKEGFAFIIQTLKMETQCTKVCCL